MAVGREKVQLRRTARLLVVVPCGRSKIWDCYPDHGSVAAADAYTGTPFRLNRQYAERFGDAWVVFRAKCGFISREFLISEPYVDWFRERVHELRPDLRCRREWSGVPPAW